MPAITEFDNPITVLQGGTAKEWTGIPLLSYYAPLNAVQARLQKSGPAQIRIRNSAGEWVILSEAENDPHIIWPHIDRSLQYRLRSPGQTKLVFYAFLYENDKATV